MKDTDPQLAALRSRPIRPGTKDARRKAKACARLEAKRRSRYRPDPGWVPGF